MVDLFPGYYPFTRKQLRCLLNEATVVFGASVLLDLYRISYWKTFLDIVEAKIPSERLWLPYDTAWLYHSRLPRVVKSQLEDVKSAARFLEQFMEKVDNPYGHPFISSDLIGQYKNFVGTVSESLKKDEQYLITNLRQSELKSRISLLFKNRVGLPYSDDQMVQLYDESIKLNKASIPPCITLSSSQDIRVKSNRYIVWKQLQKNAIETKKPVLLVLNRITPNWFDIYNDESIFPRHELVNEFKHLTEVDIHITTAFEFIKHFGKHNPQKDELLTQLHSKPTPGNQEQIQIPDSANSLSTTNE